MELALINYDKRIKINARCTRSLVIVICSTMAVLRQQINNHGHQHNDESNATARSPGSYGNNSIDTPPGRQINGWRFSPFPPTRAIGRWGFFGPHLRPFPPPPCNPIHPSFTHPQFDCTNLLRLHSQHRTAGIERLATDKYWPGELCPHRCIFNRAELHRRCLQFYSGNRGRNWGRGVYEFQGW